VINFAQGEEEGIDQAWERFNGLIKQGLGVFGRAPALKTQLWSCRSTQFHRGAAAPWISHPEKCLVQLQNFFDPYDM
jgi:hypothetical protein